ncbi:hypothetical protein [Methyloversatilis discipulorum]|uniref:hypothetical protein n=1 Tax=Methyloversatilis discipulorum TaxID=1119528 RepID=UPI000376DF55|nr:hypothetical protein [Methyloversatilis discipulorum]
MHADCIKKVMAAAGGRKLSDAKIKAIDDAISGKMRELARVDPDGWRAKSADQRITEAAKAAMDDLDAAAKRKEMLAGVQVLKSAEAARRVDDMRGAAATKVTRSQALARDIENSNNYVHAVHDDAVSSLGDMLDAASSKDGTGVLRNLGMRIFDLENPQMTADVVREVFKNADGSTGNAVAKAGARAWLDTIERLRVRFNAAGGDVGRLDYGYIGQAVDQVRVQATTPDDFAGKVLPLLDRRRYLNEDGSMMNDAQVREILRAAHETLASDGMNKTEPGQFKGAGARANRGSESRVLHFKDGDAWIDYMREFGEGSLYDSMMGHIGAMARNIGLVERYGPNPEQTFRVLSDIAEREDGRGTMKNRALGNTPQAYWDILSGKTSSPENARLAAIGQGVRNVQTAAKLGSAIISSLTDIGTIAATLHYDRLPYFQMLKNIGKNLDADHREFLQAHGVIAESLTSTLNRWTGDHLTNNLTGRVASSVMKLSFMNAWTDGLRRAFSATMMQGFAKKVGTGWQQLDEWDRFMMARKGITEDDWNIIAKAKPTERGGDAYLTRDAIMATGEDGAQQAATKWMAFVSDEAQFAIVNPDMATRAIVTGGGMPTGTVRGEAMRSFMQFKSFPTAMVTRHWRRLFDTPQGLEGAPAGFGAQTAAGAAINRTAVFAGLNVSLMLLGAIVLQEKAILQGKDPYDMTEPKFWARALGQGGGLGYVGDFITKDPTEQRGSNFEQAGGTVLGPAGGAVAGLAGDLVLTNLWEAAKGKDTHFGAEALRWLNSQAPGVSLWQVRGAWDHWFLHNMQENLNPGYLSRMRNRAMQDWGQDYWWQPGEFAPERAPDFSNVTGD